MLCLSGFELYSRWVPLYFFKHYFILKFHGYHAKRGRRQYSQNKQQTIFNVKSF